MVKTLLGLIGSPRKLGNSELLVKEIYRHLPEGWELKLLRLPQLDIRSCKGCYQCLFGKMTCIQKDDFQLALDALVHADAYVVASPTYVFGANASLKRFLDRGLSFYRHVDALWGKPAVGAVIAGFPGLEGYAKLTVDSFIKFTLAEHRGSEVVYAALPGEIFLHDAGKEAAKRLASALISGKRASEDEPPAPRCQLCGGDTFRFVEGGRMKCMLCSHEGGYQWENEQLQIDIRRGKHPIFLTREDVKKHLEFLQGMKEKFAAERKQLKEVVSRYAEEGTWIRPPLAEG
ncbi:MAG: flavodoxin family protein [Deltaproteobacteria bacterium]